MAVTPTRPAQPSMSVAAVDPSIYYEIVTANQSAQVLGLTGAAGDFVERLIIQPTTTSPGQVGLTDDSTGVVVFAGGASSVADLRTFVVDCGFYSRNGAWKVTTGANVSCIAVGRFS
jgi:hypothetical protein